MIIWKTKMVMNGFDAYVNKLCLPQRGRFFWFARAVAPIWSAWALILFALWGKMAVGDEGKKAVRPAIAHRDEGPIG